MSAEDRAPERGDVWREKRRDYAKRTVRVVGGDSGFVAIEGITGVDGLPLKRRSRTRVRRSLWHRTFEYVGSEP